MIKLAKKDRLLFIGDSITDAGRNDFFKADLGQGYVNMIAGQLYRQYFHYQLEIINRGISGNTISDLVQRWQVDCLDLNPNIVTIQIGINNLWQTYNNQLEFNKIHFEKFIKDYEYLITSLRQVSSVRQIILMEPYLIPHPDPRPLMRENLNTLNRRLANFAKDQNLLFVETNQIMNRLAKGLSPEYVTGNDGVHPTSFGHAHLAERWFVTCKL